MNKKSKNISIKLVVLVVMAFSLASCSSQPSNESKKNDSDAGFIKPSVTSKNNTKFDSSVVDELPNSEVGGSSFAYRVAGILVSTDVLQKDTFSKVLSKNAANISIDGLMQRNQSVTLPRITFSPIGIAVDKFSNGNAIIAVVGLSFESNKDKVISNWKEVRMNLSYENGWKVQDYTISVIGGPTTDSSSLSSEFLVGWSGYNFPASDISSGQKSILNQISQGFGTVDENGIPVTFPPGE